MNYFGRIISSAYQAYSEINPATLTGAIDVIIVEQEDGSFACSPFHVRFGKIGVLRSREKIVDIEINGEPVNIHMKLGDSGEAYFVEEVDPNDTDTEDPNDPAPAKIHRKDCDHDSKSDSEYEIYKSRNQPDKQCHHDDQDTISWNWGELPQNVDKNQHHLSTTNQASPGEQSSSSSTTTNNPNDPSKMDDKDSKEKSNVFGFLFKNSKSQQSQSDNEDNGIYLDPLDPNELNPEVADKYFPTIVIPNSLSNNSSNNATNKPDGEMLYTDDNDIESGTGASLSASPQSVSDFPSFYPTARNEHDEYLMFNDILTKYHDLSMSLCGRLEDLQNGTEDSQIFLQSLIRYEDFIQRPEEILNNPNLVIRFNAKYYSWKMASAILMSFLAFQRELPKDTIGGLKPSKKLPAPAQNPSSSGWTSWFRSNQKDAQARQALKSTISAEHSYAKPPQDEPLSAVAASGTSAAAAAPSVPTVTQTPPKANKSSAIEYTSDEEILDVMVDSSKSGHPKSATQSSGPSGTELPEKKTKIKFRKVLTLKSDVIRSLNLKPNCNDVAFSVTTAFQGTTRSNSKIFLWKYSDKIVISDIDGTITRSDVLGHVLPYFGKDWAQAGVTKLFSNIESNGYKFLYLSARAIGQAKTTRDYLRDLKQEEIGLPDGPLLLSPTSLISALHREVIEKKPEEFKIACLNNIKSLFPSTVENPFFAGFGNKVNDNWAYKAVGIDQNRIFTINPKGELKLERLLSFKSSYADLSQFADQMFPPVEGSTNGSAAISSSNNENTNFSDFMFWRSDFTEPSEDDIRKISVSS